MRLCRVLQADNHEVKADVKAKLEDGPDPTKPGGNRDALQVSFGSSRCRMCPAKLISQVLSSSFSSLLAALAYRLSISDNVSHSLTLPGKGGFTDNLSGQLDCRH